MTKTDPKDNIVLNALKDLPSEETIDEAMERLLLLSKIEEGLHDAKMGNVHSIEEVEGMLEEWLK